MFDQEHVESHVTTELQEPYASAVGDSGLGDRQSPTIIIAGAGMSGMLMAYRLLQAGITSFEVLEKSDSAVGGTWRDNTYPGLACDIPAYWYAYSFEPNFEITHRYLRGPQLRAYFEQFADKHGLRKYIRLNQTVESVVYEEGGWTVTTTDGKVRRAKFYVSATGILHLPSIPNFEGVSTFEGPSFHSARWDHSVDLQGKRVGLIGTGSTAVQITCGIHERVEKLSLFQRTAHWVHPAADKAHSALERWCARNVPGFYKFRVLLMRLYFEATIAAAVVGDQRKLDRFENTCRTFLETVEDPELRAKLTPDYRCGCKRLIISDDFYQAVQSPAVDLVTTGIDRIEPAGIRTKDGRLHELDVIVFATGFHPEAVLPIEVTGRHGQSLTEEWSQGAEGYLSVVAAGYPNFFMTLGPHSPGGNYSVIGISECQTDYIMQLIEAYRAGEYDEIDVKPEAQARFNESLYEQMKNTVWVSGCQSWYQDSRGIPILWPWTPKKFRRDLAHPNWSDFELRHVSAPANEPAPLA